MSKTRYDFREAQFFLNECMALDDLYSNVCVAMDMVFSQRLSKKKKNEMYGVLLSCADFLETITPK